MNINGFNSFNLNSFYQKITVNIVIFPVIYNVNIKDDISFFTLIKSKDDFDVIIKDYTNLELTIKG